MVNTGVANLKIVTKLSVPQIIAHIFPNFTKNGTISTGTGYNNVFFTKNFFTVSRYRISKTGKILHGRGPG